MPLQVADSDTVRSDYFLAQLMDYITAVGRVVSAAEYQGSSDYASLSTAIPVAKAGKLPNISSKAFADAKMTTASAVRQLSQFLLLMQYSAADVPSQNIVRYETIRDPDRLMPSAQACIPRDGGMATLEYPPILTSFQRRVVHIAAEQLALQHQSQDGKKGRFITVTAYRAPPSDVPVKTRDCDHALSQAFAVLEVIDLEEEEWEDDIMSKPAIQAPSNSAGTLGGSAIEEPAAHTAALAQPEVDSSTSTSPVAADAPVRKHNSTTDSTSESVHTTAEPSGSNALLNKLHLLRQQRAAHFPSTKAAVDVIDAAMDITAGIGSSAPPKSRKHDVPSSSKAHKASSSCQQPKAAKGAKPAPLTEEEEWALLESAAAASKHCAAGSCKGLVSIGGTNCKYCNLRYCYKHALAEAHGCDMAAHDAARKAYVESGGKAVKSMDATARMLAARQLHKKIDAATAARTAEPKDKDKSKKK
jgi:hypothetical protein